MNQTLTTKLSAQVHSTHVEKRLPSSDSEDDIKCWKGAMLTASTPTSSSTHTASVITKQSGFTTRGGNNRRQIQAIYLM